MASLPAAIPRQEPLPGLLKYMWGSCPVTTETGQNHVNPAFGGVGTPAAVRHLKDLIRWPKLANHVPVKLNGDRPFVSVGAVDALVNLANFHVGRSPIGAGKLRQPEQIPDGLDRLRFNFSHC